MPAVRGLDGVHPGDDEVAGQPGVVGRAQLDLHPPLGRQRRHLALHPQPLPQVEQDLVRPGPADPEPLPPPRLLVRDGDDDQEDQHRADAEHPQPARGDHQAAEQEAGEHEQPELPQRQAEPAEQHRHREHGARPHQVGIGEGAERENAGQRDEHRRGAGVTQPPAQPLRAAGEPSPEMPDHDRAHSSERM